MLAIELVANAILPVHTSDTIQKVLDRMIEFRVRHLPIVNEDQFLGLVAESDLIAETDYQVSYRRTRAFACKPLCTGRSAYL